jgi:hypothetical protein
VTDFGVFSYPLLQATEFAPQLADAYTYLGNALSEVGNFNEARNAYQSSVRTAKSTQSLPNPKSPHQAAAAAAWLPSQEVRPPPPHSGIRAFGETASRCPLMRVFTTLVVATIR